MDMRDTGPRHYLSITAAAPSLTGSQSASPASLPAPPPACHVSRVTRHVAGHTTFKSSSWSGVHSFCSELRRQNLRGSSSTTSEAAGSRLLPCCSWSWLVTMISSLSELAGEAGPGGPHSVGGTSGARGELCRPFTGTVRDTGLVWGLVSSVSVSAAQLSEEKERRLWGRASPGSDSASQSPVSDSSE